MSTNVEIQVNPENLEKVIKGVAEVLEASVPSEPIIGIRRNIPGVQFLVYVGVRNPQEIALRAMMNGASVASIL